MRCDIGVNNTVFGKSGLKSVVKCRGIVLPAMFLINLVGESVLRRAHSVFQSQFFTQCHLVLPLSISSILARRKVVHNLLTSSYLSSCHFYASFYLSFSNVF